MFEVTDPDGVSSALQCLTLKHHQLEHLTLTGRPEICWDSLSAKGTTKKFGVERIEWIRATCGRGRV